ncbi:hypothetical protein D3C87_909790 [compost metagenome]
MNRQIPMLLAGGLLVGAALAVAPAVAREVPLAEETKAQSAKGLQVEAPWVREAPPGARVLGAYMTLVNGSARADRLLSVSSPLAGEIEIHRMTVKNGMMDMEAIPFLTVPARGEVKLQPGGNHLMIYGMKRELKEGDRLPLELKFEHAGTLSIEAPVRKVMGKHQP